MEILPIDFFGVQVDVPFPAPLGFSEARLEAFGAALCDTAKGLSLRADQIRLKRWDDLFGYELSAQFFGENGTLTRTADTSNSASAAPAPPRIGRSSATPSCAFTRCSISTRRL